MIEKSKSRTTIVGMSCRFPQCNNPQDLWMSAVRMEDNTQLTPMRSYDLATYYDVLGSRGKTYQNRAGYLAASIIKSCAEEYFEFLIDPQQTLLLELTREAILNAGVSLESMRGTQTAVIVASTHDDYLMSTMESQYERIDKTLVHSVRSLLAGRISHTFDFRSASLVVDTACSGGLVAIWLADLLLSSGAVETVVTAGVNLKLLPFVDIMLAQGSALARDGRSKFGSIYADGFASSEGAAVFVLTRKPNRFSGVEKVEILGIETNNDGRPEREILTPSLDSHVELINKTLSKAQVSPSEISYIEAHGTGNPIIDATEMRAFDLVYGQKGKKIPVGSIKNNIGHSEAAAGFASIIKAAAVSKNGLVPGVINCKPSNPDTEFDTLLIPDKLVTIKKNGICAVHGQGIAGTNCHIILKAVES